MKIAVIYGTSNKKNTYHLTQRVLTELAVHEDCVVEEVYLNQQLQSFCLGCNTCFYTGEEKCPHAGEIKPIMSIIDQADLIIFASPVYAGDISASLKNFFDHTAYRWLPHRPQEQMFHKRAILIATSAGAGLNHSIKTMKEVCTFWGISHIFPLTYAMGGRDFNQLSNKDEYHLQKKIHSLVKQINVQQKPHPSWKQKGLFLVMRMMHKQGYDIPLDYDYWNQKGWLNDKRPWK